MLLKSLGERKPFLFLLIIFAALSLSARADGSNPGTISNHEHPPLFTSLEEALKNPAEVYRLQLKRKRYREIPPELFTLTNLTELDLSNNRIEVVPDEISTLRNLQTLRLSNNRLHTISDSTGALTKLENIDLSRNHLVSVPATIGNLTELKSLEIWRNEIGSLPLRIAELSGTLIYLDIRQNPYPPENIEKLRSLLPDTEIKSSRRCACNGG